MDDDWADAREILLIHDHVGSPVVWVRVERQLRSLGLLVRSVEWPGGAAGSTGGYGLARVFENPPHQPVVVVGHGRGATGALRLAAGAPQHVGAVVLVAPVSIPHSVLGARWATRYGAARLRIRCAAVLVTGTRDYVTRPHVVRGLARLLPQAHRIRAEAGHLIPIEDPDAVVRAVLHGLARTYQQSRTPRGPHRPVPSQRSRTAP